MTVNPRSPEGVGEERSGTERVDGQERRYRIDQPRGFYFQVFCISVFLYWQNINLWGDVAPQHYIINIVLVGLANLYLNYEG